MIVRVHTPAGRSSHRSFSSVCVCAGQRARSGCVSISQDSVLVLFISVGGQETLVWEYDECAVTLLHYQCYIYSYKSRSVSCNAHIYELIQQEYKSQAETWINLFNLMVRCAKCLRITVQSQHLVLIVVFTLTSRSFSIYKTLNS